MKEQHWLNYLREQYPPGTRIKLTGMADPYSPVEPGTLGTVQAVDDAGTIEMKWDNGRTLGLIPGQDSFTVLPPQTSLLKLYMPMRVDYYEQDDWGGYEDEPCPMTEAEAAKYVDNINAALLRERRPDEAERGMMTYYGENDTVNQKVKSYNFTAEARDGRLWGVAECQVQGELTPDELELLKENISGQASDGFGEGFEQRPIKTPDDQEIYAHLWQWDTWMIQTEQEAFPPKLAPGLPDICFSILPGEGKLICLKKGETGYYPSDWSTSNKAHNRELADYNNEKLGVTGAQRRAMEVGSMCGWEVPGADPASYEQEPESGLVQSDLEMEMG